MELIPQHTKHIMEGCKERARAAGLRFADDTLEYIVTNRDLLELTPKVMIPTLYDYWVHDVEVLREKGRYELYPSNPYETVVNTRPAISFYNDNNPDWLNVMIFYHVLAHIDFFQNNHFFRHTWAEDFTTRALSDKRLIARLRGRHGRWVDYVIEFARGVDNLVGYHEELRRLDRPPTDSSTARLDYYFDRFLQDQERVSVHRYIQEVERYNDCLRRLGSPLAEQSFFAEVNQAHPEFEALFHRHLTGAPDCRQDLLEYLVARSPFLQREENRWMKDVIDVVRRTSLFFQPQIRTKIMNEGWASYWHDKLFLADDRIRGHEVDYARVNANVTAMPRVGLNPYALGLRLFAYIEASADRGRDTLAYERLKSQSARRAHDDRSGRGRDRIFQIREDFNDFMFIQAFIDQDFVDAHRLFVADRRLDEARMVWQYVVRSRKAEDYRHMINAKLYHPPDIRIVPGGDGDRLQLDHQFEGRALVREYIANTMLGLEVLWGSAVVLETTEPAADPSARRAAGDGAGPPAAPDRPVKWQRVRYTMENRKLTRQELAAAQSA